MAMVVYGRAIICYLRYRVKARRRSLKMGSAGRTRGIWNIVSGGKKLFLVNIEIIMKKCMVAFSEEEHESHHISRRSAEHVN